MPQGSKAKYSAKQKRQAEHIEESYEKRGDSPRKAAERAWRTVNKRTGGAKKAGGSSRKKTSRSPKKKTARKKKR
jgi:plasmid stabilization system protein ParE